MSHLACADEPDHADERAPARPLPRAPAGHPGGALQPGQFGGHLPRRRILLRPDPARAWRSTAACRSRRRAQEAALRPVASIEAADPPGQRTCRRANRSAMAATFVAPRRHEDRDPQHRLCRRLSRGCSAAGGYAMAGDWTARSSAGSRWTCWPSKSRKPGPGSEFRYWPTAGARLARCELDCRRCRRGRLADHGFGCPSSPDRSANMSC